MLLWRAHHTTTPLGKLHRDVVDVLTVHPYDHSVNSIDTWYLVWKMMLVLHHGTWYLLVLWQACIFVSFCLFVIVLSFSLPICRNSIGTVFLIVSFSNDNSETFGTISTPTIFLSTSLIVLVQILLKSIHIQTGAHSPMPSGVRNDTHQTSFHSGPTAVRAGGPLLP